MAGENIAEVGTEALAGYRGCALLGSAGLGKTVEINHLAELENAAGREVRIGRIAELAQSPDALAARLERLAQGSDSNTVLLLDALDEAMVPIPQAGRVVSEWLRTKIKGTGTAVRIACRSAIFPESVRAALAEVFPGASLAYATLTPLTSNDIEKIAGHLDIDAGAFSKAVQRSRSIALAELPLTLKMLLHIYKGQGDLPSKRMELFELGLQVLASEDSERIDEGTAIEVPLADLLDAAERLACYLLLSGNDTVDYNSFPTGSAVSVNDLATLPGGSRPLENELLRALRHSGLCEGVATRQFRFAHRQFAEYLAGRRLARLLPHQARAILGSSLGWQAGVSGPLRETAAFAAMANSDIARWIANTDPEVIGLSDITDFDLRRSASLSFLDRLRRHEITDVQLWRQGIELKGFFYPDAMRDLQPVLQERGAGCEDVLEGAIRMINSWELAESSNSLATLMLDTSAPLGARQSAGHALVRFGSIEARARLVPLVSGSPEDPQEDLKGLSLECNYPQNISDSDLLEFLTWPQRNNYGGSYFGFIHRLNTMGFSAAGSLARGLEWAEQVLLTDPTSDSHPLIRIAKRIVRCSVSEINNPEIATRLSRLLLRLARVYAPSPLSPARGLLNENDDDKGISTEPAEIRQRLFQLIVETATSQSEYFSLARRSSLFSQEDLGWLLGQAADHSIPLSQRVGFAELARMVPWDDEVKAVELWLRHQTDPLIGTRIPFALWTDLDSQEAAIARAQHNAAPSVTDNRAANDDIDNQLLETLGLAESKSAKYFHAVSRLLSVSREDPHHYTFERFLTKSDRWGRADEPTRGRIVVAAKRFLTEELSEATIARNEGLDRILGGVMQAVFLLLSTDSGWLDSRSEEWWEHWAWYFLRELHPYLVGESSDEKRALLVRLFRFAGASVTAEIARLAESKEPLSVNLLAGLLNLSRDSAGAALDVTLSKMMLTNTISVPNVEHVARFILDRDADCAVGACLAKLDSKQGSPDSDKIAVACAVALLSETPGSSWTQVSSYLRSRSDLAAQILGEYSQSDKFRVELGADSRSAFSIKEAGQLAEVLIEHFPYSSDLRHEGVHSVGPSESARHLRDRIIGWLSEQREWDAVEALRAIEHQFGHLYPFLRRPRASAERGYRLSTWAPMEIRSVASLLAYSEKHLIRSASDALDAVSAAIEEYAHRLKHSNPNDLEDFWNRSKHSKPTPKAEERASEKISAAIHDYLNEYALTTDREVQVFRRLSPTIDGGEPSSEVDVLCKIPATGTVSREPIVIPVELKYAHNPEVKDGMNVQLVDRYMRQLGAGGGVYVVVWMDAPRLAAAYKPRWKGVASAKHHLDAQVERLRLNDLDVRAIIVDASISSQTSAHRRSQSKSTTKSTRKTKRLKPAQQAVTEQRQGTKRKTKGAKHSVRPARKTSLASRRSVPMSKHEDSPKGKPHGSRPRPKPDQRPKRR